MTREEEPNKGRTMYSLSKIKPMTDASIQSTIKGEFLWPPQIGGCFLFIAKLPASSIRTSTVTNITLYNNYTLIETLNSTYKLETDDE